MAENMEFLVESLAADGATAAAKERLLAEHPELRLRTVASVRQEPDGRWRVRLAVVPRVQAPGRG